jgi:lipoate-protein ligase B
MIVVPAATPVTTPEEAMVAFVVALLNHVPPVVASVKVVVLPAQTVFVPDIAGGVARIGLTVNTWVAAHPVAVNA